MADEVLYPPQGSVPTIGASEVAVVVSWMQDLNNDASVLAVAAIRGMHNASKLTISEYKELLECCQKTERAMSKMTNVIRSFLDPT